MLLNRLHKYVYIYIAPVLCNHHIHDRRFYLHFLHILNTPFKTFYMNLKKNIQRICKGREFNDLSRTTIKHTITMSGSMTYE